MTTVQAKIEERCRDCDGTDDVQDGLCYTCECENYVWCTVCQERIDTETALYRHRHLYWSIQHGAWSGPGSDETGPLYERDVQRSLFAVLDKDPALAAPLAESLEQGTFYAQLRGSFFGAESITFSFTRGLNFGDDLMRDLTEAQEEVMAEGVCWLLCFYKEQMPEARAQTVRWIRAWEEEHHAMIRRSRQLSYQAFQESA